MGGGGMEGEGEDSVSSFLIIPQSDENVEAKCSPLEEEWKQEGDWDGRKVLSTGLLQEWASSFRVISRH